jgi:hypothetical protein
MLIIPVSPLVRIVPPFLLLGELVSSPVSLRREEYRNGEMRDKSAG